MHGDKMHDPPSRWIRPLTAIIEDPRTTRRRFSNSIGQTTRLPGPVSSSMVMNMTPLADPGFCRTRTRPAA
jgi:hypothetical protein